jgi:hypothetical protein
MKTQYFKVSGAVIALAFLFTSCASDLSTSEIKGCMDPASVSYNPEATVDNGGCVYIPKKQNSLFYKYTATWCGPCGEWGAPAFEEVVEAKKGQILAFTLQVSDDFTSNFNFPIQPVMDSLSARYPYTGTPNFVVNNTAVGTSYSNAYSSIATNTAATPTAGVAVQWTVGAGPNAGKLNINAYTQFFSATNGTYQMAVYVLYKKVVNEQNVDPNGMQNDFEHHHVLIGAVNTPWGKEVGKGSIAADKVSHLSYVYEYPSNVNVADLEVVAVLWKKNTSGSWDFVNCTTN